MMATRPRACRVERERVGIVGQDRGGAARGRLGGEGAPVALRAAQRGEQKARLAPGANRR